MKSLRSGQAGFTLVELLVGLGVSAVLVGVLASSAAAVTRGSAVTTKRLGQVQDLQLSTQWLSQDIGRANTTNLVDGAPSVPSAQFTWRDGAGATTCTYSLAAAVLQRQCPAGAIAVARSITSAAFSRTGSTVSVELTSAPALGQGADKTWTLNVSMRGE